MPDRLAVNENNNLEEISIPENPVQPNTLRIPAAIISYIFHPLFIPVYFMSFLIWVQPQFFAAFDVWDKLKYLIQVIVNCTFLPLISILLLRQLKFIDSIFLKTQKDRIAPYIIIMVFYFWNWYVFKNLYAINEIVSFSLAMFIASILGFLANIFFKISMHAIAMGLTCTFFSILTFTLSANLTIYLSASLLIAGLVCTSRLIVSDHSPREIFMGFLYGVFSQLIAYFIVY